DPDLAMPWPAWYELDGRMPATVALSVPPSVLPSQIPLYMADVANGQQHSAAGDRGGSSASSLGWLSPDRSTPQSHLSVTLQLLDREQYGRELQIRDLAQRVVYALAADARRIDIPLPFAVKTDGQRVIRQPQE